MRTTVTLDSDTEALVRRVMAERGVSFKQALNDAIRAGDPRGRRPSEFRTDIHHLGEPIVVLDKALQLAADLEDDELIRKMRSGK